MYRGEWVLMRMTGLPDDPQARWGEVLVHSPRQDAITRMVKQAHQQDPTVHLCSFLGGMRRLAG